MSLAGIHESSLFIGLAPEIVDALFKKVDTKHTGVLTQDQFHAFCRSTAREVEVDTMFHKLSVGKGANAAVTLKAIQASDMFPGLDNDSAAALFKAVDQQRAGSIKRSAFREFVNSSGKGEVWADENVESTPTAAQLLGATDMEQISENIPTARAPDVVVGALSHEWQPKVEKVRQASVVFWEADQEALAKRLDVEAETAAIMAERKRAAAILEAKRHDQLVAQTAVENSSRADLVRLEREAEQQRIQEENAAAAAERDMLKRAEIKAKAQKHADELARSKALRDARKEREALARADADARVRAREEAEAAKKAETEALLGGVPCTSMLGCKCAPCLAEQEEEASATKALRERNRLAALDTEEHSRRRSLEFAETAGSMTGTATESAEGGHSDGGPNETADDDEGAYGFPDGAGDESD